MSFTLIYIILEMDIKDETCMHSRS